jgi:hypothetical protein
MRTSSLLTTICLASLMVTANAWAQGQGDGDSTKPDAAKKADAKPADAKPADAKPADAKPADAKPADDGGGSAPDNAASGDATQRRVQLRALEQRVNELKERIFRSKARLNLLKETVLHGVIAGSRAVIRHKNEMGSSFRMVRLTYAVDGAQIYASSSEEELKDKKEFDVFNGSIVPGNHTISVVMVFRGHGYGIFTYLKGYRFTVRASYTFTAAEGRQNQIIVRAYERGNPTTELKDRPAIKFQPSVFKVTNQGTAKKEAKK